MNLYPLALTSLALALLLAEGLAPWRRAQRRLRPGFFSDALFFLFNGYVLGALVYALVYRHILPPAAEALAALGVDIVAAPRLLASWPLAAQIVAAVVLLDLAEYAIHNLLHRSALLWQMHKVHHTIADGEMDFLASFRFHFGEAVVYSLLQLPVLLVLGLSPWAVLVHSLIGTLCNFLNHANLDLGGGRWAWLLNSPRMHLWHHDAEARRVVNFGVIFSAWDRLFRTARLEAEPPRRLGLPGQGVGEGRFLAGSRRPLYRVLKAAVAGARSRRAAGAT